MLDSSNVVSNHPRYIRRLAGVYLDKHRSYGYDTALAWYNEFIPDGTRELVREEIQKLVSATTKDGGTKV